MYGRPRAVRGTHVYECERNPSPRLVATDSTGPFVVTARTGAPPAPRSCDSAPHPSLDRHVSGNPMLMDRSRAELDRAE